MIKEIIDKLVALLAVSALLASCSESELWQNPQTEARDGYIMLNFKTEIPAMQEVVTRAVDPDGGGVQDMTLFCFDSYGLFISTVKAGVTVQKPGPGEMEGTFKAEVPENTRTIHFLANQNMSVVNRKAMEGTILAHTDGGVPEVLIEVDDLTDYNVGYLIYFFWRACACSGYLLSVNPFNQPGVESYKKNMFALLGKPGYEDQKAALEAKLAE